MEANGSLHTHTLSVTVEESLGPVVEVERVPKPVWTRCKLALPVIEVKFFGCPAPGLVTIVGVIQI